VHRADPARTIRTPAGAIPVEAYLDLPLFIDIDIVPSGTHHRCREAGLEHPVSGPRRHKRHLGGDALEGVPINGALRGGTAWTCDAAVLDGRDRVLAVHVLLRVIF